jgi:hypothetical protein
MSQSGAFSAGVIAALDAKLSNHPLYTAVQTMDDLRVFMGHHVYAVWDFMSLLKYLQYRIAPAAFPWRPHGSASARHFINQIVLAEESDEGLPDVHGKPTFASHFELYCEAMREVGVDPSPAMRFAEVAAAQGIDAALAHEVVPPAARAFMTATFDCIATDRPPVDGASTSSRRCSGPSWHGCASANRRPRPSTTTWSATSTSTKARTRRWHYGWSRR